jgi:hypothetical protein
MALILALLNFLERVLPHLEKIEHLLIRLVLVILNLAALLVLFGHLIYAKVSGAITGSLGAVIASWLV